jgi:hypothetical protein
VEDEPVDTDDSAEIEDVEMDVEPEGGEFDISAMMELKFQLITKTNYHHLT